MPLDIMMPFYGRIDHFKAAVNSVLAQTNEDWRLVIVDDVYPDLSAGQWAQSLPDPRVSYLRNEENLRPSRNYRKCVGMMESRFGVLMGCDDVMLPNYVDEVTRLIAQFPDAWAIQPGVSVIDGDGKAVRPLADRVKRLYRPRGRTPQALHGETMATSLLRGNWTYFPSLCWRVEAIRDPGFRVDLDVVQDLAMLLSIAERGGSLVVDDTVAFHYRRHRASVSAVTGPDGTKFAQERTLFSEVSERFAQRGWARSARAARRHLSSRLNAMTELPAAVRAKGIGAGPLVRHAFGPTSGQ